ncbi:hypothetical protein EDD17DRAFT_1512603 [Pisolithus thermaeus]|nr:hypothetical protein EDD17DRAFT_1512603 [Pisolithus thermaeus]
MFVKNSLALQDTVDRILTIFEHVIINLGRLDEAEKLEQWRNAVRDIQWELVHCYSPSSSDMMQDCKCNHLAPTTEATSIDLKPVYSASHGSQGVSRPYTNMKHSIRDESEDVEEDIEMDDIEPAHVTIPKMRKNASVTITNDPKGQERLHTHYVLPALQLLIPPKSPTKPPPKLPPATPPHLTVEICLIPSSLHFSHDELDQMVGCIDEGEQQIACVMHQIMVPTPGTVEDHMYTIATLMHELEAFWVNLQHPRQVQDNSTQTPQADTGMTPPAIDHGVELLATESSDNGGQGGQGEEADIMEGTAVAGEAQPIIVEEGGIGGEHHQMMEENSGECPTEAEGGTTILVSEGQVAEVSGINTEEELVSTGGKFPEEH